MRKTLDFIQHAHRHYDLLWVHYLCFIALFFFMSIEFLHTRFYLLFVLTSAFLVIPVGTIIQLRYSPIFISACAYLIYSILSLSWSNIPLSHMGGAFFDLALLLSFITITVFLFLRYPQFSTHLCLVLAACALINAIISIEAFESPRSFFRTRFYDIGRGFHPIKTAAVFGSVLLWVLYHPIASRHHVFKAIAFCLFLFVLFTESRGPLLAIFVTIFGSYLFLKKPSKLLWPFVLIILIYLTAVGMEWVDSRHLFKRFDNGRLGIFEQSIPLIQAHPFIGSGMLPEIQFTHLKNGGIIGYPHNIILSQLLHGGIVGCGFLLAFFAMILRFFYSRKTDTILPFQLIGFFIICGMFDFSLLLTPLSIEWLIFWLPVSWLIAQEIEVYIKENALINVFSDTHKQ